jgi:hypothetical protein
MLTLLFGSFPKRLSMHKCCKDITRSGRNVLISNPQMKMGSQFQEERRVVDDAFNAYASIALFFETEAFLDSERGRMFKDSKLLHQSERAKDLSNLDSRTHMSNKTMPSEFWADWDKLLKDNKRKTSDESDDIHPLEWRKALRPIIARRKCSYTKVWKPYSC